VVNFWQTHYAPANTVIAAAGNLSHEKLLRFIERYFNYQSSGKAADPHEIARVARSEKFIITQPINQAHMCTGGRSIPYKSEDRFALLVMNAYLGGGMSSRLFQRLRERRGLAYNVYSFADFYSNIGLFGVYLGTDNGKIEIAQKLLDEELSKLRTKKISQGALQKIKNQLKGSLVLGLESTSRRMTRLAKNELYFNEYVSIDSLIHNIDSVTPEDVMNIANNIIHPDNFITVILQPAA
jgi:predicted Zn-dependent peptidase